MYGSQLHSTLGLKVQSGISKPVPAALGIERDGTRVDLRIEYDDAIAVRPVIVAEFAVDIVSDLRRTLQTAMEYHMDGAFHGGPFVAAGGDIDVSGISHAGGAAGKFPLVEGDGLRGQCCRLWLQWAVNLAEDCAGLIVGCAVGFTTVDIGGIVGAA